MTFPEAPTRLSPSETVRRHVAESILPLAGGPADPAAPETIPDLRGRRLVFACRSLVYSGSGRVLIEQLAALAPTGATADLFCFEDGSDPGVAEEIRARCPGVRRIRRVSRKLRDRNSVLYACWPGRHDLWISTDTPDPLRFAAKAAQFRFMRPPRVAVMLHEPYDRYLAVLKPYAARIAAFCLDYDFRADVRAAFGPAIPAGIVAPLFPRPSAPPISPETARRALALPPDAAVLGYAGRLGPNKRIERMLDLLAALLAEGRDRAWLLLAGRWEEEAYRRAVEARLQDPVVLPSGRRLRLGERVRLAGPRPSLAPLFPAMDLFLLLSRAEGFYPLSVMEAQQAGVPVVCTAAGGLPRVILDGVTGFRLPGEARSDGVPYGPETAALALVRVRQLLDDAALRTRLGEAGRDGVALLTTQYPFARLFRRWVAETLAAGGAR